MHCSIWFFLVNSVESDLELLQVLHNKNVLSMFSLFLSLFLYTAWRPHKHYRQVYFVHSGLQDESLLITVGFFNMHKGCLSPHRGHPVNVPIRRTAHLSSVIPANDTKESVFEHQNFPRRVNKQLHFIRGSEGGQSPEAKEFFLIKQNGEIFL